MVRSAALIVTGIVLVCVGVVWVVMSGAAPPESRPDVATTAVAERPEVAVPIPAGRAGTAHPERSPFPPSAVTFADADRRDRAPVDRVRTNPDGSLDLPADPSRMGWWTGGSEVGAPYGSVVMAGHLDSREFGLGFSALMSELDVGERVVLSDDDQTLAYVVTRRYLQPRASVAGLADLFSDRSDARLVMITCGGTYDHAAGAYSDNLVVEAVPAGQPRRLR